MPSLDPLLAFTQFIHLANKVERVARTPGETRNATLVEHSFQLALTAWYIMDKEKLSLDKNRVLTYALAHDLIEVYSGDTYLYDEEARKTKHAREAAAVTQLKKELSDFPDLCITVESYEKKEDPESVFVYALDKLVDPINIYLEDGKLWKDMGVSLDMILEKKTSNVALHDSVKNYFDQLAVRLKERESELF